MFQVIERFNQDYTYHRTKPVHRISASELRACVNDVFPSLDTLIHQPVRSGFRGGGFSSDYIRSQAPANARLISFPSLQYYGYQPASLVLKNLTLEQRQKHTEIFEAAAVDTFHFTQVIRAYLEGLPATEALKRYHDGYGDDGDFALDYARRSLAKITAAEAAHQLDVKVAGFINDTYQSRQLFNTPRHPTSHLLVYVIDQMAALMGLPIGEDDRVRLRRKEPLLFPSYPVQNYVREAQGLTFPGQETFRTKRRTFAIADMAPAFYSFYDTLPRAQLEKALHTYEIAAKAL